MQQEVHILHRGQTRDPISGELNFGEPLIGPEDANFVWTQENIQQAQIRLLKLSMEHLEDTRVSRRSCEEIMAWVNEQGSDTFGFLTCAATAGIEYGLAPEEAAEAISLRAARVMKRRFPNDAQPSSKPRAV